MAQLIKLHHFPSRYEVNIFQYSSRYIQRKERTFQNFLKKNGYVNQAKFYDDFFKFQFIWATSTPKMESTYRDQYRQDDLLKALLKMFDDTLLMLYHPTFQINNTEIDGGVILLTPFAVWCVQIVVGEKESVFQGVNVKEWKEIMSDGERRLESPYHSLNYCLETVQSILNVHHIEMPIKGCVFVPESYVEFVQYGSEWDVIDRVKANEWVTRINHHRSTLKHAQLRAAELLLKEAKTVGNLRV